MRRSEQEYAAVAMALPGQPRVGLRGDRAGVNVAGVRNDQGPWRPAAIPRRRGYRVDHSPHCLAQLGGIGRVEGPGHRRFPDPDHR